MQWRISANRSARHALGRGCGRLRWMSKDVALSGLGLGIGWRGGLRRGLSLGRLAAAGEVYGQGYGAAHGAGVGSVFSYDVEGGAVVWGGADDGEAEGEVDGLVEGEEFDGDEALVVIHGDDCVVFAFAGGEEDGVWGVGAGDVDALFAGHEDGGGDEAFFFVAELAGLGGVGIQSCDGDAGFFDVEPLDQGFVDEFDGLEDGADVEATPEGVEADVAGGQDDFEGAAGEHHVEVAGVGAFGEELGVAGVVVAGEFPGFFGDGGGDDGVDQAGFGGFDGVEAEAHGGLAADFAGGALVGREDGVVVVVDDDDVVGVAAEALAGVVAPPEDFELGGVGGVGEELVHAVDDEAGAGAEGGV